jgi:2-amino-4-hydroxy-6-hydroxymethyldihydropteridine diphosphokinase
MPSSTPKEPITLAIALGANLPSQAGSPIQTLVKVRPELEAVIQDWVTDSLVQKTVVETTSRGFRWRWSPLFETDAIGGPNGQPPYINAVLVVDGPRLSSLNPSKKAALNLLERFLKIEKDFGRDRNSSSIKWGPRTLDLDLLAWGGLHVDHKDLTLPHPRLIERNFVILPLAEALKTDAKALRRIPPQANWNE